MLNAALYVVVAAILFALILARTHGHFTYCLDDPYIHLALADRIRHGLYGLNAGEAASPSSSIVWPLLFVPFAGTAAMPWLPLVLNLLCGAATAWLLGLLVASVFGADGNGTTTRWRVWLLASLLVFALNLLGLTYTGLEHSLEVLLCVVCALSAVRAMHGEQVTGWGLAAAVVLPSIRYEGLLITVALAVVLVGVRAWRAALGIVLGSMVLPAAFSLFLHRLGLPWFPLSVLVKSSYKFADQSSPLRRAARLLVDAVRQAVVDPERLPQLIVTLALATLAWKHRRTRSLRFAFTAAAGVGIVQLVVGPVGWFYRYELYALAFTVPVLIAAVALSITGTFIIAYGDTTSSSAAQDSKETIGTSRLLGNLVACIGAVAFGLYEVLFKKWADPGPAAEGPDGESMDSLPLAFAASALTGVYTMATLWVGLVVLHVTGVEVFVLPDWRIAGWIAISVLSGSRKLYFSAAVL
ncbi:MAG: hypothetical protein INR71_12360, partial [Terriglobus roseus]|nr:hypothetical protein [Terriglobus roseus]